MANARDYGISTKRGRSYTSSNSGFTRQIMPLAWRDMFFRIDDFDEDTLDTFWTAVANGGGSGAASPVISVGEDGRIVFVTGTAADDTASSSLISQAMFYGDRQAGVTFGIITPGAVTALRYEMGFADVVPGSTKSVVNSLATPTVNTSIVDAAVYVFDHTTATTTHELVTIGTAISAAKTVFTPGTAWGANEYHEVTIQLGGANGNKVKCFVDDVDIGDHNSGADSIEGGSALAIWMRLSANNGTSKSGLCDYVARWKDRKRA